MDFCVGALLPVDSSSKAGVSSKDLACTPRTLLLLHEWTCALSPCCLRTAVISAAAPLCTSKACTFVLVKQVKYMRLTPRGLHPSSTIATLVNGALETRAKQVLCTRNASKLSTCAEGPRGLDLSSSAGASCEGRNADARPAIEPAVALRAHALAAVVCDHAAILHTSAYVSIAHVSIRQHTGHMHLLQSSAITPPFCFFFLRRRHRYHSLRLKALTLCYLYAEVC
jgi:hypothetical protein